MTEDDMYDIISDYQESEYEYHERNIELKNENTNLKKENARLREENVKLKDVLYDDRSRMIFKKQEELIAELRNFAKTCITIEDCGIDCCPFEKICNSATREIYGDGCKLYEEMQRLGVSD